ncbi:hypothetical protein ACVI1J_004909 [Bradyrhizobium diazoefficiens]|uniref:hypothetical protein n=1 Tax=Bradyrhizobium diazoefficiens TaxID=1355477 RepID=UPI00272BDB88|nr:hypothetical protein [Bradyrhizobium diazoefficiens]WLA66231.1 hypothetical protein QNN01_05215 [Bradyrhizobium diazoefficiens]
MLIVTIDLLPGGAGPLRRTLATVRIENLSDLAEISDYRVTAMEAPSALTDHPAGIAATKILAHPRRQRVWALLQKACEELMSADWVEL